MTKPRTYLEIRREFKAADDVRDAGLDTPEDVIRFDSIPYGSESAWQTLDVYRPENAEGKELPVIVSVHGGGWVYGDKERYQYYCMSLAQRGFAVVNFTYRLAPEFKFPAQLEDVNTVFHWVLTHGKRYGMDTQSVFAVGDSAGAHLLGLYTGLCTDREYASRFTFQPPVGFKPLGIALNCGCYEIRLPEDPNEPNETRNLMKCLLPGGGTPEELEMINVLHRVNENFPPVFLMTCCGDFLYDEVLKMEPRMIGAHVRFIDKIYGAPDSPLFHVFHVDTRHPMAKICNDDECDFFRDCIHRRDASRGK